MQYFGAAREPESRVMKHVRKQLRKVRDSEIKKRISHIFSSSKIHGEIKKIKSR